MRVIAGRWLNCVGRCAAVRLRELGEIACALASLGRVREAIASANGSGRTPVLIAATMLGQRSRTLKNGDGVVVRLIP